jgi:hypothetical protein
LFGIDTSSSESESCEELDEEEDSHANSSSHQRSGYNLSHSTYKSMSNSTMTLDRLSMRSDTSSPTQSIRSFDVHSSDVALRPIHTGSSSDPQSRHYHDQSARLITPIREQETHPLTEREEAAAVAAAGDDNCPTAKVAKPRPNLLPLGFKLKSTNYSALVRTS